MSSKTKKTTKKARVMKEEMRPAKKTKQTPRGADHDGIAVKRPSAVVIKKAAKPAKEKKQRAVNPYRAAIEAARDSGKVSTFEFQDEAATKQAAYQAWGARRLMGAASTVMVSMAQAGKVVIGPATEKPAKKAKVTQAAVKAELHAAGVRGIGKARAAKKAKKASSAKKAAVKKAAV